MMLTRNVTSVAAQKSLAELANWGAERGLKGLQMQASAGGVTYGGKDAQLMAVPSAAPTDVLPVAHLNDLYLKGAGTVTVVLFF